MWHRRLCGTPFTIRRESVGGRPLRDGSFCIYRHGHLVGGNATLEVAEAHAERLASGWANGERTYTMWEFEEIDPCD